MKYVTLLLACLLSLAASAQSALHMRAPAGDRYVELNPKGRSILPNGRFITPRGTMVRTQPHPYGLAVSHDGRWLVTVSSDGPQLTVIDLTQPSEPRISYIPEDTQSREGVLDAAFMGLAISPENRYVYVAGGSDWSVRAFNLETKQPEFRISCAHTADGKTFEHGYLGDMVLSRDGKRLYAVDQSNFRLLTIDMQNRTVAGSVEVGRYPFGIALAPNQKSLYVANVGMFEYGYHRDAQGQIAKLAFPPFAFGSPEAEKGATIGDVTVPALGDPNDARAMSVWTLDLADPLSPKVTHKTKTGHLVGEQLEDFPAVGGSSPNSLVATATHVYVSNGSNDSITVIDAKTGERVQDIDLVLDPRVAHLRGMIPFGLALSHDQKHLYVAEAGVNAVGIIRLSDHTVVGHLPTAWFPAKLAEAPSGGRLYIACAKGIGSGPNAGPDHPKGAPTGIGDLMYGYVNIVNLPSDDAELQRRSEEVVANNVDLSDPTDPSDPADLLSIQPSPIKHIIYVTKENRTYDEVFGALPGGRGDKTMARLGTPIEVVSDDGTRKVQDVVLMPNHIALAKRFAINDNFYCDSDHSTDGHRWLVGTYPNEFMEAKIGENAEGEGPGNHLFIGSSGAIYPEDYNEAGSIWEHFERNKVTFFNYGLGFEFKPQDEEQSYTDTGIRLTINYPLPAPLFERTSREYATYNTNIPDQFRMDMFEKEFKEKWLSGKEPFPQVITMMLPNDHGAKERPADGYPFWGSYMSDNDLALGRLVELISHSPYWKETAIFVTEDDAQGYRDTVDAHRSLCMVISPYAKQGHISHTHASIASILKTQFALLGLPPPSTNTTPSPPP